MRKSHQFRPTGYDLLEERLVLSHVTLAAGPPPGTTIIKNRNLIVTPTRIGSVQAGIAAAFDDYLGQSRVANEGLASGRLKLAQFNRTANAQLAGLSARIRTQASKLPFGVKELFPRIAQSLPGLSAAVRGKGLSGTAVLVDFAQEAAAANVEIYLEQGFASGRFFDSTKVTFTH